MLAIVLFLRGCASLVLATWIYTYDPGWRDLFRGVAFYALIDGGLGLLTATLVASIRSRGGPRLLTAMTFSDALVRLATGGILLSLPSIAEIPMTVVPLLGAIGATASGLGVFAFIAWAVAHHRHGHTLGYEALFDPIPAVAVVSIGIGTMLLVNPPARAARLGMLIGIGGLVLGLALVVSSIGALIQRRTGSFDAPVDRDHAVRRD
jgi:hypothetical protein